MGSLTACPSGDHGDADLLVSSSQELVLSICRSIVPPWDVTVIAEELVTGNDVTTFVRMECDQVLYLDDFDSHFRRINRILEGGDPQVRPCFSGNLFHYLACLKIPRDELGSYCRVLSQSGVPMGLRLIPDEGRSAFHEGYDHFASDPTPIWMAAHHKLFDYVGQLSQMGASLTNLNSKGDNIYHAIFSRPPYGFRDWTRRSALIQYVQSFPVGLIDQENNDGYTPLMYCLVPEVGVTDNMYILLQHGADGRRKCPFTGDTWLHVLLRNDNQNELFACTTVVDVSSDMLLERNNAGETPWTLAHGENMLDLFLSCDGFDVNCAVDSLGNTKLHTTLHQGNSSLLFFLFLNYVDDTPDDVDQRVDLFVRNEHDQTPLCLVLDILLRRPLQVSGVHLHERELFDWEIVRRMLAYAPVNYKYCGLNIEQIRTLGYPDCDELLHIGSNGDLHYRSTGDNRCMLVQTIICGPSLEFLQESETHRSAYYSSVFSCIKRMVADDKHRARAILPIGRKRLHE